MKRLRRLRRAVRNAGVGIVVLATVVGPVAAAQPAAAATTIIRITDRLDPASVTVPPGTEISWVNDDAERHRVRSTEGPSGFDSGNLEPGEEFAITLETVGTYRYLDDRNEDDQAYWGTIVVQTSAQPPPSDPPPPSGGGDVTMAGRVFRPGSLTINVGDTVTFVNDDDRDHTATANDRSWDSGLMPPGDTYARTFNTAGTFGYVCLLHADMVGTITVLGSDGTAPPPADPPPPPPPPAPVAGDVTIIDNAFQPASLTVTEGSTVTWANNGALLHTVTGAGFDSGLLSAGDTYTRTFAAAGTYNYICTLHPEMTATLTVTGADGTAPPPADPPPPSNPPPPAVSGDVTIVDNAYRPAAMTVTEGSTITWANNGALLHTVTGSGFDSGLLSAGDTYRRTFAVAGTYNYVCTLHPEMRGTVTVTGADGTAPPPTEQGDGAPSTPPTPASGDIVMGDNVFRPGGLTVQQGATVTWANNGALPHTATAADGSFDSGIVMPGERFRHRFVDLGTFSIVCTIHPEMSGSVTVVAGDGILPPLEDDLEESADGAWGDLAQTGDTPATGPRFAAEMFDLGYSPDPIAVEVGTTVEWTNVGALPHTVTDPGGGFDSGIVEPGGTYRYTFVTAGTFEYVCTLHPNMVGTVIVTEPAGLPDAVQDVIQAAAATPAAADDIARSPLVTVLLVAALAIGGFAAPAGLVFFARRAARS